MRRVRELTLPQRVAVVVGLGALLLVGWVWWYMGEFHPAGGWFDYAPDSPQTDTYYVVRKRQPAHLAVPVIAVVLWTVVSVWLLGARDRASSPAEQEPSDTRH